MHALELKVPPVAVVLFMAALMWLVARAAPAFELALPARRAIQFWAGLAETLVERVRHAVFIVKRV
jgi:hypothetical protein